LNNPVHICMAVDRTRPVRASTGPIIDMALWDKVHAILQDGTIRTDASADAGAAEGADLRADYYVSQDVLKHGPEACPIGRVPAAEIEAAVIDQLRGIFRQPEIVVGTWRAARAEKDDVTEDEAREALMQLDPLWDELFPAEQARIVQLLLERVDVRMHGVEVRLRPNGLAGLVREVAGSRRAAA
jgi:site-specific DNA recombinase